MITSFGRDFIGKILIWILPVYWNEIYYFVFVSVMNNFLFTNDFLTRAVDWDNILNISGQFFILPNNSCDGFGYIRVDLEVIEHVMATSSMLLERDAFAQHVTRLEAGMAFLPVLREINIPLGFNPEFDIDGKPTQALHRIRRRMAMKDRLTQMHCATPQGVADPLYLCMLRQKDAILEFVTIMSRYLSPLENAIIPVRIDCSNIWLSPSTRSAIQGVTWGPICYLGYKCGYTFTFNPFCPITRDFRRVA